MNLTEFKQEQLLRWWVEIVTEQPYCIYYFGPFVNTQEAQLFLPGYVEDIQQEGSQVNYIEIKQCQPKELTIIPEEGEDSNFKDINSICHLNNTFLKA